MNTYMLYALLYITKYQKNIQVDWKKLHTYTYPDIHIISTYSIEIPYIALLCNTLKTKGENNVSVRVQQANSRSCIIQRTPYKTQ